MGIEKNCLVLGIAGQDGSYLTEHLQSLGHKVYGLVRRNSVAENQISRLDGLENVHTLYGDVTDVSSLIKAFDLAKPDYVFNLAAQSHVRVSFDVPQYTAETNGVGVIKILDIIKDLYPEVKFYQASSSEMFGNSIDSDLAQRETTPMHPVSPYGCAKLYGYHITRTYRNSYNLFAANGILFNHESPRRGSNFVTNKIAKNAVEIYLGKKTKLELGNLEAKRDWGHSKDYVRAMLKILEHDVPEDFVISTGQTRSVRQFCEVAFKGLGLNYEDHIVVNPKFFRPQELNELRGDSSKAQKILGWQPEITFDEMVEEMVGHWITVLS